jgi:hypothetical protein
MTVDYESPTKAGDAETVDVSASGLFLRTRHPLPVGTVLQIRFGEASLRARVARVVEPDSSGRRTPGMGVAIFEADTQAEAMLREHLRRHEHPRVRVTVDEPWPEPLAKAPGAQAAGDPPPTGRSEIASAKPPSASLEARSGKKRGRKRRDRAPAKPES